MRVDFQFLLKVWEEMDGVRLVPEADWSEADEGFVFVDASGHVTRDDGSVAKAGGYGGVNLETGEVFGGEWPEEAAGLDINVLEALTSLIAVSLWGEGWRGRRITLRSDNTAAVAVLNKGVARDAALASLTRRLFFEEVKHDCQVRFRHVAGVANQLGDLPSRGRFAELDAFTLEKYGRVMERVPINVDVRDILCRLTRARRTRAETAECSGSGSPRRRR